MCTRLSCNRKELISVRLTHSQRELLEKATTHYQRAIQGAETYLATRGLSLADAATVRLGYVEEPLTGHEQFIGRLAIPYITPSGVVDIRFRAVGPQEPKYMGMAGTQTHLYNVAAIATADNYISVTEGEIDAITLNYKCGIPAIGVPGANSWKRHYSRLLQDFEKVYVFADGDQSGSDFAKRIAQEVQGVTIINMPEGHDVNSMYLAQGAEYFAGKVKQ
jgi:DNA primase